VKRLVAIASAAVAAATATATASVAAPATAAASATEPAAATAAATEPAATAAASTTAFFAGPGFVDGKGASAMLLPVERCDRRLGFLIGAHFDETETFGTTGVAVVDDLGRHDGAVLPEQLFEFRAIHAVAQVPDVKLLTH